MLGKNPENQKHIIFWIAKTLGYYCNELDFMLIFPKNSNEKAEFIVTANDNFNFFPQVVNLINNEPRFKTWKFIAFIQPTERIDEIIKGIEEPIIFQDITSKANEHTFLPLEVHKKTHRFDIVIFLKNYNLYCDTKTLQQAIFIILQDLVGEKSLYQNINLVQLAQERNDEDEMIKLYDLQLYIDSINKIQ